MATTVSWLKKLKKRFDGQRFGDLQVFDDDGSTLLDLPLLYRYFLNSAPGAYHRDQDKKAVLRRAIHVLPPESIEAIGLCMMRDKAQAAVDFGAFLKSILHETSGQMA